MTKTFILTILLITLWTFNFAQTAFQNDSIKIHLTKKKIPVFTIGTEILSEKELVKKLNEVNDFELNFYTKKFTKRRKFENGLGLFGASLAGISLADQGLNKETKIVLVSVGVALAVISLINDRKTDKYLLKAINRYNLLLSTDIKKGP